MASLRDTGIRYAIVVELRGVCGEVGRRKRNECRERWEIGDGLISSPSAQDGIWFVVRDKVKNFGRIINS